MGWVRLGHSVDGFGRDMKNGPTNNSGMQQYINIACMIVRFNSRVLQTEVMAVSRITSIQIHDGHALALNPSGQTLFVINLPILIQ